MSTKQSTLYHPTITKYDKMSSPLWLSLEPHFRHLVLHFDFFFVCLFVFLLPLSSSSFSAVSSDCKCWRLPLALKHQQGELRCILKGGFYKKYFFIGLVYLKGFCKKYSCIVNIPVHRKGRVLQKKYSFIGLVHFEGWVLQTNWSRCS